MDEDDMKLARELEDAGHIVIYKQNAQQCDMCGEIRELRPYGPNGEVICFPCATATPEAEKATKAAFKRIMDGG